MPSSAWNAGDLRALRTAMIFILSCSEADCRAPEMKSLALQFIFLHQRTKGKQMQARLSALHHSQYYWLCLHDMTKQDKWVPQATMVSWVLKKCPVSNFFSPLLHRILKQKLTPSTNKNQSRNESVVQVHPSVTDQATLGCSPGSHQQVNRIRKNPPGQFCLLEVFIFLFLQGESTQQVH